MLCFDLQKQRYRAAINRKKRFRNPDKQPLPFDPDIVGRVVASQQAFRNRNYLYIGYSDNATGALTLGTESGSDTPELNAKQVHVARGYGTAGGASTGTLTVQGAGTLNATHLFVGDTYGDAAGVTSAANGYLYVKDNAAISVSESFRMGVHGMGTADQTGGNVTLVKSVHFGGYENGDGTYNISGGTLNATSTSSQFYVGYEENSRGEVNVSGNAVVNINTPLYIGYKGTGEYEQTDGTTTVNNVVGIGYNDSAAIGTLTVSGGTFSATEIIVGNLGAGTFNLGGGVANLAGGAVNTANSGTFNFKGGTLKNAATVSMAVNLQSGGSGAVFQQANYAGTVSGDISGGGTLTKTGAESLTLSGTNSYTGLTTVQEGTLQFSGATAWNPILSLGGADVQAGKLVFDYSGDGEFTPAADVFDKLDDAYDNGFLSGQIFSSEATTLCGLGWIDDTANSQLTVQYAIYGDATLDGEVNADDLTKVLTNYNSAGNWATGDFTYDGVIDADDLTKILANYNTTMTCGTAMPGAGLDAEAIAMLSAAGFTVVPEPSTFVLLAAGLLGLFAYAWKKRK